MKNAIKHANAVSVIDFTVDATKTDLDTMKKICNTIGLDRWTFQEEKGKQTGYLHWQGRLAGGRKCRHRLPDWSKLFKALGATGSVKCSETSTVNRLKIPFYCMKEDTRVSGPYRDAVTEWHPPSWVENAERMYPYQQQILDACGYDRDGVNVIYNEKGLDGKTETLGILEVKGKRVYELNPTERPDRMIYTLAQELHAASDRFPDIVATDLPKSMDPKAAWAVMIAMEQLTRQKIKDTRHTVLVVKFACPSRWIFTNRDPVCYRDKMSEGRWRLWRLEADKTLTRYEF